MTYNVFGGMLNSTLPSPYVLFTPSHHVLLKTAEGTVMKEKECIIIVIKVFVVRLLHYEAGAFHKSNGKTGMRKLAGIKSYEKIHSMMGK